MLRFAADGGARVLSLWAQCFLGDLIFSGWFFGGRLDFLEILGFLDFLEIIDFLGLPGLLEFLGLLERLGMTVLFGNACLMQVCRGLPSEKTHKKSVKQVVLFNAFASRGDWIRTSDHTPPRRVL